VDQGGACVDKVTTVKAVYDQKEPYTDEEIATDRPAGCGMAPVPRARVRTAAAVKAALRRKPRHAYRMSCHRDGIDTSCHEERTS